jgi:hypothetical protein
MIHAEELRIGNRVCWKPHFSNSNILIQVEIVYISQDKVGYMHSQLEHRSEPFEDDVVTKKIPYASFEELLPISLTEIFLTELTKKIKYPKWIQYLHELQNWYYWENGKKELAMDE